MEVEIISKEYIKPSFSTPYHLKTHKLSFLDLYILPTYIPQVLYFPFNQDTELSLSDIDNVVSTRFQLLKQSLSETLSRFYPLAGKIKDSCSIDCNDEGIYFVEARVKSPLNKFLSCPDTSLMINKFLPEGPKWSAGSIPGNYVAGVQITTFACGGIAIGAFISHMITDGTAFNSFIRSWAARTAQKNTEEAVHPKLDATSFFPPNDAYPREVCLTALCTSYIKFGKYVTRRFVFDASAIADLKSMATSSSVQKPTRVEVITAFLGKCVVAALKARSGSDKPFLLTHAINLRQKFTPPFSEYYMGNFLWIASALCKTEEAELHGLVCQLRKAITKLNADFASSLQGVGGLLNFLDAVKHEGEAYRTVAADKIAFTSLCNSGIYDVDYGWGNPAWMSTFGLAESINFSNLIILTDTRLGNGVEAWVYLREEDMAALELDKDLLAFATMDPSALKQGNYVRE